MKDDEDADDDADDDDAGSKVVSSDFKMDRRVIFRVHNLRALRRRLGLCHVI